MGVNLALIASRGLSALLFVVPQRSQAMFGVLVLLTLGRRFPHAVQNNKPLKAMFIESLDGKRHTLVTSNILADAFRQQSVCTDDHA